MTMSSDDLIKQLEALQRQAAEAKELLAPLQNQEAQLNAEQHIIQEAFNEQMAALRKKQQALKTETWAAQSAANEKHWEIVSLQAKIEQAKKDEAAAIEAKKAAEAAAQQEAEEAAKHQAFAQRMDTLTAGLKWREWAKDHQLTAGRKIAQDRYVILADPMGLGKTLSSMITVDMAQAATRDASTEFPVLGETQQVWVGSKYFWGLDPQMTEGEYARYKPMAGAEQVGYMDYDTRNKFITNGTLELVKAHYEEQIVNSIERPVGRKVLYLCPSPLLRNVLSEFRNYAPHRNATYIGGFTKQERNFFFDHILPQADNIVVICNYEAWRRDRKLLQRLKDVQFDTVIIDEAHNIKDMTTSAYQGVEQIILQGHRRPEYVIPMTGTPVLNKPQELFPMLHLILPERFFDEKDYLYAYCEQDEETGKWKFQPGGLDRLFAKMGKHILRRTKDQAGIVLPEKTVIHHDIPIDEEAYPNQARARKQMRDFATIVVDEAQGKALSANVKIALITRLRQIETWPAGIVQFKKDAAGKNTDEIVLQLNVRESQKVDYIINPDGTGGLVPEVIEDERIVIFSQFKAPLYEIYERIRKTGYRAAILDGSTSPADRDDIHRDFDRRYTPNRSDSQYDVVLCNYRVGGVGLNLTAATQLIALDEEWNPGKRDQAFDRIHRIGQTEPITIHVLRSGSPDAGKTPESDKPNSSIDQWLADIIDNKEAIVDGLNTHALSASSLKDALDSGLI